EIRHALFQLPMHLLGAADEPHGRHAVSPSVQGGVRRREHLRMGGEPEVVVGAKVQHIASGAYAEMHTLRRPDDALLLVRARGTDLCNPRRQPPRAFWSSIPFILRDLQDHLAAAA